MDVIKPRQEKLLAQIKDEKLDGVLITNPINVSYLTGFTGEASYLVVSPSKILLVSDGRFTQQLREECPGLETVIRPPKQTVANATAEVLEKVGLKSVGIESGHLTVAEFQSLSAQAKSLNFKPAADRVEKLRQVKDASEIDRIRKSIRMAEKAFAMFVAMIGPEDTEKQLADNLEMYVRRAGGSGTAFPSIVAVGDRAALPHAPPTGRRVCEGSLLLVDWGATGHSYKSDLTRVLVPHNNAASSGPHQIDDKLREVHDVVLRAQTEAVQSIRPGVKTGDIDAAARKVITDAGYGEHFTHSTGHGFGLQIHEAPLIKPGADVLLQPGMVVTVEPGIYLPGWGGVRIEDDILVTADGAEVLTSVPRELSANVLEF